MEARASVGVSRHRRGQSQSAPKLSVVEILNLQSSLSSLPLLLPPSNCKRLVLFFLSHKHSFILNDESRKNSMYYLSVLRAVNDEKLFVTDTLPILQICTFLLHAISTSQY